MFKLDLEKAEESDCQHPLDHRKSKRIPEKIYFHFIDYVKAFVWITTNWKTERNGNTRPPYLPPEKLYAGQEATVRNGHGTMDWFKIGKGVHQGCILSP